MGLTLWHNPKCSKSRQALQLLEDYNIEFELVEYLKNPPTQDAIEHALKVLTTPKQSLIRLKDLSMDEKNQLTENNISEMLVKNPKLIERPLLISKDQAIIGRPPENIKQMF